MKSLSILIVDDEQANCENLADILQMEGHQVTWFVSPQQAIDEFRNNESCRFDLAILDLKMPGMDGVAMLKELRQYQAHLKAILTTAYVDEEEFSEVDRSMFEFVMSKPIQIESLIQKV